jgi:hypothetical protein
VAFFVSIGGGITFQETTQYNKKQTLNKKTKIATNKHPRKNKKKWSFSLSSKLLSWPPGS